MKISRQTLSHLALEAWMIVAIGGFGFLACKTWTSPITGAQFADCTREAGKSSFYDLLPRVQSILAAGAGYQAVESELGKMVVTFGVDEITCLVAYVAGDARRQAALPAVADRDRDLLILKQTQADAWLSQHGAKLAP